MAPRRVRIEQRGAALPRVLLLKLPDEAAGRSPLIDHQVDGVTF